MDRFRVFYLDDDEEDIELFLLATENFDNLQVIVFTDSELMLRKLHRVTIIPNALFVDVHMPKVSGYEVIREVRVYERYSEMPIVVVSGNRHYEADKFRLIGANYFVIKPITVEKLQRTLRHVFEIDFASFVPTTENFVLTDIDAIAS